MLAMRDRLLPTLLLGAALALPPSGAGAQTVPDPATPAQARTTEIEVRGKRAIDKAIVADNLAELTARIPVLDVVPRFFQPLCLHVIGPDVAANRTIATRITAAATLAGLKPPKPKCRENALVITVDEPERLFEALVGRRHWLVGDGGRDASLRRLRDELASGKPAIAWNRSVLAASGINYVNQPGDPPLLRQARPTRIMGHVYRSKLLSVVIFDTDQLGAATPTQLGDYAAMHLLATPKRNIDFEAVSARSILTLFADEPQAAPGELTAFDRAYLQGVYAVGRDAWRGRVNKAVLDAYEARCGDAEAEGDCQFMVSAAAGGQARADD